MSEKNFLKRAFEDMRESAKVQHEIDKQNFEAVKADSKARFEEAKKVNPDFQEFKEAKGLRKKAEVVMEHAVRNGKEIQKENIEKQKEMLDKQRQKINEISNLSK